MASIDLCARLAPKCRPYHANARCSGASMHSVRPSGALLLGPLVGILFWICRVQSDSFLIALMALAGPRHPRNFSVSARARWLLRRISPAP